MNDKFDEISDPESYLSRRERWPQHTESKLSVYGLSSRARADMYTARIVTLEAEVARLRAALQPFAKAAAWFGEIPGDEEWIDVYEGWESEMTIGDLRRAADALKG